MFLLGGVRRILLWQCCCNVEIATSDSKSLQNVDIEMSSHNQEATLARFWVKNSTHNIYAYCNGNVNTTLQPQPQINNDFSTPVLGRSTNVTSAYLWTYDKISATLSQSSEKRSILWYWVQPLFPFHTLKFSKNSFWKV